MNKKYVIALYENGKEDEFVRIMKKLPKSEVEMIFDEIEKKNS